MSKEIDKLAGQMRNLKPSKKSRESGLDAAMAAFSKEFAAETSAETATVTSGETAVLEKNLDPTQGLSDVPRPTGKRTTTVRATSRRVETMAKIKSAFNFKPQTMMMAGTCSAALIAAMIVIPNMDELGINDQMIQSPAVVVEGTPFETAAEELDVQPDGNVTEGTSVPASKASEKVEDDVVVVTGVRAETVQIPAKPASAPQGNSVPQSAPTVQESVTSLEGLLNNGVDRRSATPEQVQALKEYRAVLQQKDNAKLFNAQQAIASSPPPPPKLSVSPGFAFSSESASSQRQYIDRTQISIPSSQAPTSSAPRPQKFGSLTIEEGSAEYKTVTETVVVQEASTELVTIPATFETVKETVVVKPASVEYEVTPAEYEWVEGEIDGSTVEYVATPPVFETYSETIVVQEASTQLVAIPPTYETVTETIVVQAQSYAADGSMIPPVTKELTRRVVKTPASTQERRVPAVTKTETRRRLKTPASTVERTVPYQKKDGKTRVPVKPATVKEKPVAAVTKEVSRRVIKTPARTVERTIPSPTRTYERQVLVKPSKFYLRDG